MSEQVRSEKKSVYRVKMAVTLNYSARLNLPKNRSPSKLIRITQMGIWGFTKTKFVKVIAGHGNIEADSESGTIGIVRDIRDREDTGDILALGESNPHSKTSNLKKDLLKVALILIVTKGTNGGIKRFTNASRIRIPINE